MGRTSPNKSKQIEKEFFPYYLGNNQLSKLFSKYFLPIFNTDYKEGSKLASVYKDIENGKSAVYVEQPELEKKLWDSLITPAGEATKYLVGATGVGKTTLIRNVFKVFDRKPVITKNNLIIYHSFYNMEPYRDPESPIDMLDGMINTVDSTCTFLSGYENKIERLRSYKKTNFYEDFYKFLVNNNSNLDSRIDDDSEFVNSLTDDNFYAKAIDSIKAKDRLDFYLTLLKYYIYQYCSLKGNKLENIVFIFDDIEAQQREEYQNNLLDSVWKIKKCMGHQKNDKSYLLPNIKMLVTLRGYSFRIQQNLFIRSDEAHREIPENDIIYKNKVPYISEIVKKRTDYILKHPILLEHIDNIDKWNAAVKVLNFILLKTYGQYDELLLNLTHDNLFYCMNLLMRIITNKRHLGKFEIFDDKEKSAFTVSHVAYKVKNSSEDSSVPGNDEVFFSLAFGESDAYFSRGDYYLANILWNKESAGFSAEIWGPYIIKYMFCRKNLYNRVASSNYESSNDIIDNILSVFNWADESQKELHKRILVNSLKYYYESGILRESIPKPRDNLEVLRSPKRIYTDEINLFLSSRGKQLYKMLSSNSLLLQVYRDDIETNLSNNSVLTLELSPLERLQYCLQYINTIRLRELEILYLIDNGQDYIKTFGGETLTVHLLKGVKQSIKTFYHQDSRERIEIIKLYNEVANMANDNIREINNHFNITLSSVTIIK